jgi:hypothetical protein
MRFFLLVEIVPAASTPEEGPERIPLASSHVDILVHTDPSLSPEIIPALTPVSGQSLDPSLTHGVPRGNVLSTTCCDQEQAFTFYRPSRKCPVRGHGICNLGNSSLSLCTNVSRLGFSRH